MKARAFVVKFNHRGFNMDITITTEITEENEIELSRILNCTRAELPERLAPFANASLEEYTGMFLGEKAYTRGSDIREYRLALLIEKAFNNKIPNEAQVSRLFQTTMSGSRALIRSVMSKYQNKLKNALEASMQAAIEGAELDNDNGENYESKINNQNIVDGINQILMEIDGELPMLKCKSGTGCVFEMTPAAYNRLRDRFGLTPEI